MLKYPDCLLLAHAAVVADLVELLPAQVSVPISVPGGEGYQDLVNICYYIYYNYMNIYM